MYDRDGGGSGAVGLGRCLGAVVGGAVVAGEVLCWLL